MEVCLYLTAARGALAPSDVDMIKCKVTISLLIVALLDYTESFLVLTQ